jgi:hypothetical protein
MFQAKLVVSSSTVKMSRNNSLFADISTLEEDTTVVAEHQEQITQ